jgi:agmatine deiminase
MIPEWSTNFIYFSELLPTRHPKLWKQLKEILVNPHVNFGFLNNTKDIWCRDYMPVQVDQNRFVQFTYEPSYLKKYDKLKTNPYKVTSNLKIMPQISNIVLDGGNLVYSENGVILTDNIFSENRNIPKNSLIQELSRLLETDKIYIIPKQSYDIYGHADGMLRFVCSDTVIINDFSKESLNFKNKLKNALNAMPYNKIFLNVPLEHRLNWCYINYIHAGNNIIVPVINHPKEDVVLHQFEEIFKGFNIRTVNAKEILTKGGGLHCIIWSIKLLQKGGNHKSIKGDD